MGVPRLHRRAIMEVPGIRTARSQTSGKNPFVDLLIPAAATHKRKPPGNPERFSQTFFILFDTNGCGFSTDLPMVGHPGDL